MWSEDSRFVFTLLCGGSFVNSKRSPKSDMKTPMKILLLFGYVNNIIAKQNAIPSIPNTDDQNITDCGSRDRHTLFIRKAWAYLFANDYTQHLLMMSKNVENVLPRRNPQER